MYARAVAAFCLFVASFGLVSALPPPDVNARQAPSASVTVPAALSSPTSVTTTNTFQNVSGAYTETCAYTFTPVNGQIQEVKNCTFALDASQVSSTTTSPTSTASPTAAAAFVLPGTTIQVLPYGLGIYGGITAVAIAAVVYVTCERIQYRKNFRQQRMAETNLMMGYIGATKY